LTSAVVDIVEGIFSKGFLREALELEEEQMRLAVELSVFQARSNGIVTQLVNWGWDQDVAMKSVLKSIKIGVISPKRRKHFSRRQVT